MHLTCKVQTNDEVIFELDVRMLNGRVKISMNIVNEEQNPSNTMMREEMIKS